MVLALLSLFLLGAGGCSSTEETAAGTGSAFVLGLYIALAIGVSFLCSMLEAVLLSITPAFIGALSENKPDTAARLKRLKSEIDRPLAAILSLNTVAHTIGAAGAGAEAAAVFGSASLGVFSAVLTLGILVFSEIIPKTLGAVYWRSLAGFVGRVLPLLIWATIPLVWLSQGITKIIARGEKKGAVSREEIAALAQIGHAEGVFDESETRILSNLLRFESLSARDVMTPRTVIQGYPQDTSLKTIADDVQPFSRLPIYDKDLDHIVGWVLRDDVLAAVASGQGEEKASKVVRQILTVPHTLPLPRLFERLLERREHIALVVGEYGGTAGIVSMEDVIETLLGLEIVDESDDEQDMQQAARRRWRKRAERLGIDLTDANLGDPDLGEAEHDGTVRLGLTGGKPPKDG